MCDNAVLFLYVIKDQKYIHILFNHEVSEITSHRPRRMYITSKREFVDYVILVSNY